VTFEAFGQGAPGFLGRRNIGVHLRLGGRPRRGATYDGHETHEPKKPMQSSHIENLLDDSGARASDVLASVCGYRVGDKQVGNAPLVSERYVHRPEADDPHARVDGPTRGFRFDAPTR